MLASGGQRTENPPDLGVGSVNLKEGDKMLIALKDYAAMHGRAHNSARRMAERGSFDTAVKIAGVWLIDEKEPYPDRRRKEQKRRGVCVSAG